VPRFAVRADFFGDSPPPVPSRRVGEDLSVTVYTVHSFNTDLTQSEHRCTQICTQLCTDLCSNTAGKTVYCTQICVRSRTRTRGPGF
jgi:hypothetical protein